MSTAARSRCVQGCGRQSHEARSRQCFGTLPAVLHGSSQQTPGGVGRRIAKLLVALCVACCTGVLHGP